MAPLLKTLQRAGGRSLYLVFPPGPPRTPKRTSALFILRDDDQAASVDQLMQTEHLQRLCQEQHVILAFPNPIGGRWNWELDPALPDDVAFFAHLQKELSTPEESLPFLKELAASANPLKDPRFQKHWHPMADVRYAAGYGSGASMVCTLAALRPELLAGIYADGAALSHATVQKAVHAPMPAYLSNCTPETTAYFMQANAAEPTESAGQFQNPINPSQCVILSKTQSVPLITVYDTLFSRVRRPASSPLGDVAPRLQPDKAEGFTLFADDTRLDGTKHTWLVHTPKAASKHPDAQVPLLLFFHGASDTPWEAADMTKFHELGERDGFITVYPWGGNRMTWNSSMLDDEPDDDAYITALIRYMLDAYPVDPQRVYLSGFSNGAAQAHAVAMCHPDLIAAICPIDANWPGNRAGISNLTVQDVTPMKIALEKQKTFDYRMPVWYTYGGREVSYPVYNGCTQQMQYDFWKTYNHIPIKPTPDKETPHPCGCGVPGDIQTTLAPSLAHPTHTYDVHQFLSTDPAGVNLYNYVLMRQKGHEIAPADPLLGWQYVRKFRRLPDGNLAVAAQKTP